MLIMLILWEENKGQTTRRPRWKYKLYIDTFIYALVTFHDPINISKYFSLSSFKGITAALSGTALPFLRLNVGQTFSVIGLVFTLRAIGFVIASIVTGLVLRRLTEGWQKLVWIASGLSIIAAITVAVPLINDIFVLTFVFLLDGLGRGMVDTGKIRAVWDFLILWCIFLIIELR